MEALTPQNIPAVYPDIVVKKINSLLKNLPLLKSSQKLALDSLRSRGTPEAAAKHSIDHRHNDIQKQQKSHHFSATIVPFRLWSSIG